MVIPRSTIRPIKLVLVMAYQILGLKLKNWCHLEGASDAWLLKEGGLDGITEFALFS